MFKNKNVFFQRHLAFTTRVPEVLPCRNFWNMLKMTKTPAWIGVWVLVKKNFFFSEMNKGNKTVGVLLTAFLIPDLFPSILLKKATSCQKFLPKIKFSPHVLLLKIFSNKTCGKNLIFVQKFLTWSDFFEQNGRNDVLNQKNIL